MYIVCKIKGGKKKIAEINFSFTDIYHIKLYPPGMEIKPTTWEMIIHCCLLNRYLPMTETLQQVLTSPEQILTHDRNSTTSSNFS